MKLHTLKRHFQKFWSMEKTSKVMYLQLIIQLSLKTNVHNFQFPSCHMCLWFNHVRLQLGLCTYSIQFPKIIISALICEVLLPHRPRPSIPRYSIKQVNGDTKFSNVRESRDHDWLLLVHSFAAFNRLLQSYCNGCISANRHQTTQTKMTLVLERWELLF